MSNHAAEYLEQFNLATNPNLTEALLPYVLQDASEIPYLSERLTPQNDGNITVAGLKKLKAPFAAAFAGVTSNPEIADYVAFKEKRITVRAKLAHNTNLPREVGQRLLTTGGVDPAEHPAFALTYLDLEDVAEVPPSDWYYNVGRRFIDEDALELVEPLLNTEQAGAVFQGLTRGLDLERVLETLLLVPDLQERANILIYTMRMQTADKVFNWDTSIWADTFQWMSQVGDQNPELSKGMLYPTTGCIAPVKWLREALPCVPQHGDLRTFLISCVHPNDVSAPELEPVLSDSDLLQVVSRVDGRTSSGFVIPNNSAERLIRACLNSGRPEDLVEASNLIWMGKHLPVELLVDLIDALQQTPPKDIALGEKLLGLATGWWLPQLDRLIPVETMDAAFNILESDPVLTTHALDGVSRDIAGHLPKNSRERSVYGRLAARSMFRTVCRGYGSEESLWRIFAFEEVFPNATLEQCSHFLQLADNWDGSIAELLDTFDALN